MRASKSAGYIPFIRNGNKYEIHIRQSDMSDDALKEYALSIFPKAVIISITDFDIKTAK